MKKILPLIFLLFSVSIHGQIEKVIPSKPSAFYAVVDNTQTLTEEQKQALNEKLTRYKDSTTSEIAVVIIPTTGDYSVEEVALRILRDWGVGTKDRNNGIVVLVAKDDHEIRIEVGYGLEGAIPDITAKSIIDNAITPEFKQGNYYRGLDKGTDDIIKAAAGEYKAQKSYGKGSGKGIGKGVIFLFVILFLIISSINRRGGGGGMMSRRGYGGFGTGWILGSMMGGGSGGGWSGGGGGGGGFGGFGGGSGGGGGASGSW